MNIGVYKAIAKVTAAMAKEGISKSRSNQQQGYKFRGIDDVYNVLSGMLAETGLCILPRILSRTCEERTTKNGGMLFYVTVEAEYDLVAAEDGSKHTVKVYGEAMDSADKATNKAMSAAYKYMAFQTFAIPTEGDNDADAHTPSPAPKGPPARVSMPEKVKAAAAAIQKPKEHKPAVIEGTANPISGDPSEGDLSVLEVPTKDQLSKLRDAFMSQLSMDQQAVEKECNFGKLEQWNMEQFNEAREVFKALMIEKANMPKQTMPEPQPVAHDGLPDGGTI